MIRSSQPSRARRRLAGLSVLTLVGALGVIPAASVAAAEPANPVLDWNINAVNAIANPVSPPSTTPPTAPGLGQPPPLAVIHLAMVQGAVYDAVNAIDGGHEPYLSGLPSAAGANKAAAVATAAHDVLVALPAIPPASPAAMRASVDELYRLYMLEIPDSAAKTQGIAIGQAAAAAMVAARNDDGRLPMETWPIGTLAGEWRPLPNNANVFAQIADVEPFTYTNKQQFRTEGPPDMASAQYAAEFDEVKSLGSNAVPTARSEAQTSLANFVNGNPFAMYNRALREIASANGLSTTEQALLFGKTTIATADSLIACWNDKDAWKFWRPQTAIRLADTDPNPATEADPNWTALFPNPGYPDHPSGYNCFAGGTWHSVKAFFGTDKMSFQLNGVNTRSYTRFTDAVDDAIDGRILIGFHFRSADVAGAWIGKKVAQWVDKNYFEPVN